jgi:hypothetical protein
MGKKRALLVAINDYVGEANDLPSCVNDAHAIENLVKNDFGFTDTKTLFDSAATISNVEQGVTWLFDNAAFDDNPLLSNWVETLIFRRLKQCKFVKFSESDERGITYSSSTQDMAIRCQTVMFWKSH